ncbi:MAG: hypothetical protein ACLR17_08390 [Enterobacteriaceae bacterium]
MLLRAADGLDTVAGAGSGRRRFLWRPIAASRLSCWNSGPPRPAPRLPLLRALKSETLQSDSGGHAFSKQSDSLLALGAVPAPVGPTKPVRLTNRLRNLAAGALATHPG